MGLVLQLEDASSSGLFSLKCKCCNQYDAPEKVVVMQKLQHGQSIEDSETPC
jgi:hypothetical protein